MQIALFLFAITDTKLYIAVVNLSTNGNAKLYQQLKSDFKRTINLNKYQSKETMQIKLIFILLSRSQFSESKFFYHLKIM